MSYQKSTQMQTFEILLIFPFVKNIFCFIFENVKFIFVIEAKENKSGPSTLLAKSLRGESNYENDVSRFGNTQAK